MKAASRAVTLPLPLPLVWQRRVLRDPGQGWLVRRFSPSGSSVRSVQHPDRELLVLCGCAHGAGAARTRPNLRVLTGGAEDGRPRLQLVLEVR